MAVAQRLWRHGPFWFEREYLERAGVRLRPGQPINHYTKVLAPSLDWERDYLQWEGHDPSSAAGYTSPEIQRVIANLMASRWGLPEQERKAHDQALYTLTDTLDQTECDVWHVDRQTWIVDPKRHERVKALLEEHPWLLPKFRTARRGAEKEHRMLVKRGKKLAREMSEGSDPQPEKLRKTVYGFRQRGLLPDGPPPGSA